MKSPRKDRYAKAAARKPNDELERMLIHPEDWETEAVAAAKEELLKRRAPEQNVVEMAPPSGESSTQLPGDDESVWKAVEDRVREAGRLLDLGPG